MAHAEWRDTANTIHSPLAETPQATWDEAILQQGARNG